MRIQSHLKKPTRAIPSTITIMPKINRIVSQLMPVLLPDVSPDRYQNSAVKMLLKFSVSSTAVMLCIPNPKTKMTVNSAQTSETTCLSTISVTIKRNIAIKMITATTCANIYFPSF